MNFSPHDAPSPEPDSIEFESDPGEFARATQATGAHHTVKGETTAPPGVRSALPGFPAVLGDLLFVPCIAGLAWLLLPLAFRVEAALKFPYQLDAEEGFLHQQALDLNAGRSIYTPVAGEPWLVGNYPPLYPLMVAAALRSGAEGLAAGRAVVAASTILIAVLLFGIARLLSGRWLISLLPPLLFLVSYELHNWVAFCRVDLPALALTLLGVLVFAGFSSRGALVFSALCFVLAAYTRQTSLMAPAACAAVLLWKDRRGLAWFLAPYLTGGLGSFLALNIWLEGEFWRHLVEYNRNAMDWTVLRSILRNEIWFFYRWWIVGLAVGVVGAAALALGRRSGMTGISLPRRDAASRRLPFVIGYFILSALSLSAFAKSGSAPNYALEPLAASALLLAALQGRLFPALGAAAASRRLVAWLATVLVAACLGLHVARLLPVSWSDILPPSAGSAGEFMDERRIGWALFSSPNPDASEVLRGERIVAELRQSQGDVLSELPIFAIEAGRPVLFQPFIMTTLAREGHWDERPFVEALRRGRFSIIVTTQDLREARKGIALARYTPAMAEAIIDRYELAGGIPPSSLGVPYFIWKPRGAGQVGPG